MTPVSRKMLLIAVNGVLLLIALLVSEFATRRFRPQTTYSDLLAVTGDQYQESDVIPFTLRPAYASQMPSAEVWELLCPTTINSLGLRGPETTLRKPRGKKRILFLGDSYTFGVYVGDSETFCFRLQNLLDEEKRSWEVLNGGYADGWSPDEHYAWLINRGFLFEPDIVIYDFFVGNDLNGIAPEHWVEKDSAGLPRRIVNPEIYIDQVGRIRSRVKDMKTGGAELIYRIPILRESHASILLARSLEMAVVSFVKKDPESSGWGPGDFQWATQETSTPEMIEREDLLKKIILGMRDRCRERNISFGVINMPINFEYDERFLPMVFADPSVRFRRHYFDELGSFLASERIPHLDLLESMKSDSGAYYFQYGNVHFNAQGHTFVAKAIHDYLKQEDLIPNEALSP